VQQTIILPNANDRILLNPGEAVVPVFAGKLTLKFDVSEMLAAIGELQLSYDENRRLRGQDPGGIIVWLPAEPLVVGFNIMMQARF
jgi:hypothetical protein